MVPAEGTGTLSFVNSLSVAEQRNSGEGAVDSELQHHCSVALMLECVLFSSHQNIGQSLS